jgi:hypothetical protein
MNGDPPIDSIPIGPQNRITFSEYEGEIVGINEWHKNAQGGWCAGWIAFEGKAWARKFTMPITTWKVIKDDPLTLEPSIKCRACGNHGYITNGRWVPA